MFLIISASLKRLFFLAFYQSKRETGKLKGHPHDLHPCTTEVLVEAMIPSEGGRLHDQRSHGGLQWKVAVGRLPGRNFACGYTGSLVVILLVGSLPGRNSACGEPPWS